MSPYDRWLKLIAIGLEAVAEEIHFIAKAINDMANDQAPEKPGKEKPAATKKAGAPPRKATKKAKPQASKTRPAADQVLEVIQKSKTGVDNATISKETGLNQKQVSSALLRLKKYGKVKSVKRGVHTAV